jgi:hypothetical protein
LRRVELEPAVGDERTIAVGDRGHAGAPSPLERGWSAKPTG